MARAHALWSVLRRSNGSNRRDRSHVSSAPRKCKLAIEPLEDRATPSTLLVTNGLDPVGRLVPGSLRWAIAQANRPGNAGSTVAITPAVQGTINLRAGELRISANMTIENDSGQPLLIRQTKRNSRVIDVLKNPNATQVTIEGRDANSAITLTGGFALNADGGGIYVNNTRNVLVLSNVNVVGNVAAQVHNPKHGSHGNGGGIYSRGAVTLENSTVAFNAARGNNAGAGHGGGVETDQGLTMLASHVDANSARNAGGILNAFGSVELLAGSSANGNSSTGSSLNDGELGGGGIGQMDGNVVLSDSQVSHNRTDGMYSGGVVLLLGGITVTNGSQIDDNTNNGPGGGIAANFGGPVIITHGSQVDHNRGAGLGGGIVNFSDTFGISVTDNSEVSHNTLTNAEDAGGLIGLAFVGSQPSLQRAIVSAGRGDQILADAIQLFVTACAQRVPLVNQANALLPDQGKGEVGGGIASPLGEPVEILGDSRVSDNRFADVTSQNLASGTGGGIFSNLGPIRVDSSTISGNDATASGGGIWNGFALAVNNSTITQNRAAKPGGGIFNRGTFQAQNSTITGNTPDDVFPAP